MQDCSDRHSLALRKLSVEMDWRIVLVSVLILVALLLRLLYLGNVFHSSDNAELPARVVLNSGYWSMLKEPYGVLVNLPLKLFVGLVSAFGVNITEFWWKAPIALVGVLQVPLTFAFLKGLGHSNVAAFFGSAFVAVLPLHVMQSRYAWGYEVLGVFFVTLAIWALLDFLRNPTLASGLKASLFCGLYLISHGYILPFIFCFVVILLFAEDNGQVSASSKLRRGISLAVTEKVWLFPLLFVPMYFVPLLHTLAKPTQLGFYLFEHLSGFVNNVGVPLALLLLTAVAAGILAKEVRSSQTLLFACCGGAYLAPLFLGTPPGITVVRGYMLIGIYFWLLCAMVVVDALFMRNRRLIIALLSVCLVLTFYGTVESIFGRDSWVDPTYVKGERGGLPPDPGSKAAGYFVRRYASSSHKVLALHRAVEPPNLAYYFGPNGYAYYDLSLEETIAKYLEIRDFADIVICEEAQLPYIEADGRFVERIEILSEGVPRMWVYAKSDVEIPTLQVNAYEINSYFDKEYPLYITLSPNRPGGIWRRSRQ
jgi:hypothetical protein